MLKDHIKAWSEHPADAAIVGEGWRIGIADLSKVIALQPLVHTDNAVERTKGIGKDDMSAIASLSIPIPSDQPLTVNYDPSHQTWTFSSANPNLQILGQFNAQLQPGIMGFGFAVGIPNSYMQIAIYQNRYLLRDGYQLGLFLIESWNDQCARNV